MRDYDTMIEKLEKALIDTQKKVGSWQKEVLLVLLEAVLGLYWDLKEQQKN
jgi:hypothetical protein